MWLNNAWYVAGFEYELQQPFVARRLLGIELVLMRSSTGELGLLEDLCPHRYLPLSKGRRNGDTLQCGYHGMRFDISGRCTHIPGQDTIPSQSTVRRFPVQLRHGFVWFWPGDAALADPDLIPSLPGMSDPDWLPVFGYHHFEADYRLLNDNLLDLSHESYVHARTIGNDEEESIANYPAQVTVEAQRLVRAHREMRDIQPPPFFAMCLQHDGPIHRWQTAVHVPPGLNMTVSAVHPVGVPPHEAAIAHVMHLMTPETATSTHYFWALTRNFRREDAVLSHAIHTGVSATFDEDKIVIEAQQRHLVGRAAPPGVAIRLDEAPIRARRLLQAALEAEAATPDRCLPPVDLLPEESDPAARSRRAARSTAQAGA